MRAASDRVLPTNFAQLLRPNAAVCPDYLFWWLWWSHLNGSTREFQRATTNIRNLRTKDYLDQPCPLPPLNEQQRIVAMIEEQFSRLDAADRSLDEAAVKVQSLRRVALAKALDGPWPSLLLGEIASVDSGPAFKSESFGGPSDGIKLLRGENIEPGRLRWRDTRTWPESKLAGYNHLFVAETDVILAMDRPVISAGLKLAPVRTSDLPALLVQRVARIRPSARVVTPFLYLALQLPRFVPHLLGGQTGTQLPHITLAAIRAFEIPVPPREEQLRVVAEVEQGLSVIDAVRSAIEVARRHSTALRQSILRRAFCGELVPQDLSEEPASLLLEGIAATRAAAAPMRRRQVPA
jgi:type I restriction enzyme S subunit